MSKAAKLEDHAPLDEPSPEIHAIVEELDNLKEAEEKEILAIQAKYNNLRRPIYQRRGAVFRKIPNFWAHVVSISYNIFKCL